MLTHDDATPIANEPCLGHTRDRRCHTHLYFSRRSHYGEIVRWRIRWTRKNTHDRRSFRDVDCRSGEGSGCKRNPFHADNADVDSGSIQDFSTQNMIELRPLFQKSGADRDRTENEIWAKREGVSRECIRFSGFGSFLVCTRHKQNKFTQRNCLLGNFLWCTEVFTDLFGQRRSGYIDIRSY